jgi:hypothetical protein
MNGKRRIQNSSSLLQRLLATCSTREHSYDADTLNAIQGVFKTMNVHHCWGIPLERLPDGGETTMALGWHGTAVYRKKDFPSWSWTSLRMNTLFSKPELRSAFLQIEVPLADGLWLNVDAYVCSHTVDGDINLSRLVHVTGYHTS